MLRELLRRLLLGDDYYETERSRERRLSVLEETSDVLDAKINNLESRVDEWVGVKGYS